LKIPGGDELYRHAVHPAFLSKKQFAIGKFWNFGDTSGTVIEASLIWRRFAPVWQYVHSSGCDLAAARNARQNAKGSLTPKNRSAYCGAYGLKAKAIRNLSRIEGYPEVVGAQVVHKVEDTDIAHAALLFRIDANTTNVEDVKTAIFDRLWRSTRGPAKHVCECDTDIQPHPSEKLDLAPGGNYEPAILPFADWFRRIRFRVESRLLKAFLDRDFASYQQSTYLGSW
jgi:hypothetical protein